MEKKTDSVTYSAGRKLSDGNYGSHDFFVSYSTEVKDVETIDDAMSRAMEVVEKVLAGKCKQAHRNNMPY